MYRSLPFYFQLFVCVNYSFGEVFDKPGPLDNLLKMLFLLLELIFNQLDFSERFHSSSWTPCQKYVNLGTAF